MIYSLYGQPGAGKTTLGISLAEYLHTPHFIDGDLFRVMFSNNSFGVSGRKKNIRALNAVATYLHSTQSRPVVLAFVNPFEALRAELKENCRVVEIYLTTKRKLRTDFHFLEFQIGTPDVWLNTDDTPSVTFKRLALMFPDIR